MKPSTEWLQFIGGSDRGTDLYSGSVINIKAPMEKKGHSKKHIQNANVLENDSKSAVDMQIWLDCFEVGNLMLYVTEETAPAANKRH